MQGSRCFHDELSLLSEVMPHGVALMLDMCTADGFHYTVVFPGARCLICIWFCSVSKLLPITVESQDSKRILRALKYTRSLPLLSSSLSGRDMKNKKPIFP